MIKLRRIRLLRHVAHMGQIRNACIILVRKNLMGRARHKFEGLMINPTTGARGSC
jgi:hypothetical protein